MSLNPADDFVWPWQYNFSPFFTLQPDGEIRRKQINIWCQLVIDYFKSRNQFSVSVAAIRDPTCPPFNNKSIQRSASPDLIALILDELFSLFCVRGLLGPLEKSSLCNSCTVFII
ncbi:unnamed protein product [Trichobilharzia regenti]|nr:unnamed protein product [Trichobilharzia regenti]